MNQQAEREQTPSVPEAAEPAAESTAEVQPAPLSPPPLEFERLQLLTRLLLGAAMSGGEWLMDVLRGVYQDTPEQAAFEFAKPPAEETTTDLLRYLGIGLLVEGQKRAARLVRGGFYFSLGMTGWVLGKANRWTDNRLARPFRRPVEAQLRAAGQGVGRLIAVGRDEDRQARALTEATMTEVIDQVLDYVGDNPELAEFIQQMIGQQSVGMAGMVRDNARRVGVAGDGVVEGVVRRLLGRKPRRELPPSPLLGQRQDMYSFDDRIQGIEDHEQ